MLQTYLRGDGGTHGLAVEVCYWVEWPTIGQWAGEVPTHRNRSCVNSRLDSERVSRVRV